MARRRDGQEFDCATWLHKARELPKEEFRREVEKELTGRDTEPSEIVYFKLYKSQIPVVDQAIETAALMLGTDKSRGYCLEMICADFLAGANLDGTNPELLLQSQRRFFKFLGRELVNDSPEWHFHNFVGTCAACHFLPHAVPAVFRLDDRLVEKVREIIDVNIGAKNHVAASATVAAIRSAFRHKFLPAKTHTTAPAIPSLGKNFDSIDKHIGL